MKMKNKYIEIIQREEQRGYLKYRIKCWTMAMLVTGAAAIAIIYIIQHPNHNKTEQHESDKHSIPI